MSGRIEFVILRTGCSPPTASHPVSRRRSCSKLRAGERMPGKDFHLSGCVRFQAHPPLGLSQRSRRLFTRKEKIKKSPASTPLGGVEPRLIIMVWHPTSNCWPHWPRIFGHKSLSFNRKSWLRRHKAGGGPIFSGNSLLVENLSLRWDKPSGGVVSPLQSECHSDIQTLRQLLGLRLTKPSIRFGMRENGPKCNH